MLNPDLLLLLHDVAGARDINTWGCANTAAKLSYLHSREARQQQSKKGKPHTMQARVAAAAGSQNRHQHL